MIEPTPKELAEQIVKLHGFKNDRENYGTVSMFDELIMRDDTYDASARFAQIMRSKLCRFIEDQQATVKAMKVEVGK